MTRSTSLSEAHISVAPRNSPRRKGLPIPDTEGNTSYAILLAASIVLWFIAIRAPLDLDETGSYWQISAGISKIWARQFMFPSCLAYSYILWLWTKLAGISEIALRIPSIAAMLGAVYLLYLNARNIFDRESALFTAIIFCLNPAILFASIDIRPYAFAMLVINIAISILLKLRNNNSNWLAALFGLSLGCIVSFQYLFAVILPIFALCFFMLKAAEPRTAWRQFGVALGSLTVALLPILPGFLFLLRTRETHVFDPAPYVADLVTTFAPGWMLPTFAGALLVSFLLSALSRRDPDSQRPVNRSQILLGVFLGVVPVLILYGLSVATQIHVFAPRYRLVSAPGIALCWALIVRSLRSRSVRLLFCLVLVGVFSFTRLSSPFARRHEVPWKNAMKLMEQNASVDNAPVLMCSAYIESDFASMAVQSAKTSPLFAPLSYYHLSVPVVPLPRDLNNEAIRAGSLFLEQERQRPRRFLAVELLQHYTILDWLEQKASQTYTVRTLTVLDGFKIVEFSPRTGLTQQGD